MSFISKEDLRQVHSIKVCHSLDKLIPDIVSDLNKFLIDNFSSRIIFASLFKEYRGKGFGFNRSLAIEFLIYFFNNLNNDKLFKSSLGEYILLKSDIAVSKKDTSHNRTIKIYPYLVPIINKAVRELNDKLDEFFGTEVANACLYRELRWRSRAFTTHYTIEYLIFLFHKLKENPLDLKEFLLPQMKSFIDSKNQVKIKIDL